MISEGFTVLPPDVSNCFLGLAGESRWISLGPSGKHSEVICEREEAGRSGQVWSSLPRGLWCTRGMAGKKRDGLISVDQGARVPAARIYLGANEAAVLGPLACPNNFEGPLLHFVFAIVCDVSLRCSPKSCKRGLIKPGPTSDLLPSLNTASHCSHKAV